MSLWHLKYRLQLRSKLRILLPLIDLVTLIPTAVAALYLRFMRRLGLNQMRLSKAALERIGLWPTLRHYYEPYFDRRLVRRPLDEPRALPGLDLNSQCSLALLGDLAKYGDEPLAGFDPHNGTYGLPDAALLYAMLRHFRPAYVVEIGSGSYRFEAR